MELGIKGHETRGTEVIKLLESLGGHNILKLEGSDDKYFYYITEDNYKYIGSSYIGPEEYLKGYEIFSLEDFLEKFPYQVGDKVEFWVNVWVNYDYLGRKHAELETSEITSMRWNSARNEVAYRLKNITQEFYKNGIKGKVTDNPIKTIKDMEETKINQMSLANCDLEIMDGKYYESLGYKVDDVIFTNDTGWIRITNKLWDCYANEHVYEGIGIINGHEYKDIRHYNVIGKMQSEHLKHCNDEEPQIDTTIDYYGEMVKSMNEEIAKRHSEIVMETLYTDGITCEFLKKRGFTVPEGYHFIDGSGNTIDVKKIQLVKNPPHYPKTYAECCGVIGYGGIIGFTGLAVEEEDLYRNFIALKRCRDAYWKIAGEELGLDKPWEPVWDESEDLYTIHTFNGEIRLSGTAHRNAILVFPTEEMRNIFYDNFKDLIEKCKELL